VTYLKTSFSTGYVLVSMTHERERGREKEGGRGTAGANAIKLFFVVTDDCKNE
jgi:hypothetical protein